VNLVDAGRWFWHWVRMRGCCLPSSHRQGIVWYCSGDRLDGWVRVRSFAGCRQSCGHFIGSGSAALIHSRSLVLVVGSGSGGGCDDMRHRYGATIWIADMDCRYGATICKAGKQKRPRACCSWPLMLFAFVIRYCCLIHLIILPISVGTMVAMKSSSCTRPMCFIFVSHS